MLSWTHFVLVLFALEGAHACLYLNPPDSLACSSELEPLIRRDSMDSRVRRACELKCSHLHPDPSIQGIFRFDCIDDCAKNPKKYELAEFLRAIDMTHPDERHAIMPGPLAEHGVSPAPHGLTTEAEFEEWCRARLLAWRKRWTLERCMETKRGEWERIKRCAGPALPPDPNEHLKMVSPEFFDWCLECSIKGGVPFVKETSDCIKNPRQKEIWENNNKASPQVEVEFAIWCMKRGRSSGMAIAGFVKLCLKPGTKWRDEWENSTHEQPFNKRKRKPNRTGPGNAGQTKRPRIIKRAGGDARDNLG